MSSFKKAISYTKPYRWRIIASVFFNTLYALFNVIALVSMKPVLEILFNSSKEKIIQIPKPIFTSYSELGDFMKDLITYHSNAYILENGKFNGLIIFCLFFLILFLLRNVFNFLGEVLMVFVKTAITKEIRDTLHSKILQLPISYFSEKRKGDMISRITNDVNEVEGSILGSFIDIVRSPITMSISLISLFMLNFRLTLFALIIFPAMGTFMSILGKSLKRGARKTQDQLGKVISSVEETLSGLKIIKIFNADRHIQYKFEETTEKHQGYLNKVLKKYQLASPVSEFLGATTFCFIVFYGGYLQINGNGMKASDFIIYLGLFYTLLDPIKSFAKSISNIKKGEASADRIFDILETPLEIEDSIHAVDKKEFIKAITFNGISFKYEEKDIITDFNLTINKGETVALVGSSGSGKSTLANLITRFYDVNSGSILIDGIDIKSIKLHDFRGLFGMVTQDSILFNDTIYNNMCLGMDNIPLEKVIRAAKIANAHEFIEQLENGYDTNIGEGGGKLSGGQKQRLSIARAVLHDNPILVLDEATSALDTHSEKLVQEALDNMMKNRTSLVIAHRLSTIQNADKIVVLEQGKILEQGTHQELISKNGAYKKLIELQNIGS